jgi:hypothetical protein
MKGDFNSNEPDPDWDMFIESQAALMRNELKLSIVKPDDRILVKTRNTHYLFVWKNPDLAYLRSNSAKAPSGAVRIMGCAFGLSSCIRPDALFCGGTLEFTYASGAKTWTTSTIEEIHLLHQSAKTVKSSP